MPVEQMMDTPHVGFAFPLLLPLIAITIGTVLLYWWQQTKRMVRMANKIPGPPTLPILGNAHYVLGKTHNGNF